MDRDIEVPRARPPAGMPEAAVDGIVMKSENFLGSASFNQEFRSSVIKKSIYLVLLFFAYSLAASSAQHSFLQKWRTLEHEEYPFKQFIEHDVPRPYVYRVLMPGLVNLLYDSSLFRRIAESEQLLKRGAALYVPTEAVKNWSLELQTKYILTGLLMFFFMLMAMFSLRGIIKTLYSQPLLADIGPLLFALLLPLSFRGDGGFFYDFSELGLYFLGLFFLFTKRYYVFLILLPLIILNKESNLLLLFFSTVILFSTLPRKEACFHLGLQSVVAIATYLAIRIAFASHPGSDVEFWLPTNLDFWTSPEPYLEFMSTSTFFIPFPKPSNILLLPILLWLAFHQWKEKPLIIRRLFIAAVIINIPLFLLFCYRDEFRNLSLIFPFYFLLACHTIVGFYSRKSSIVKLGDNRGKEKREFRTAKL